MAFSTIPCDRTARSTGPLVRLFEVGIHSNIVSFIIIIIIIIIIIFRRYVHHHHHRRNHQHYQFEQMDYGKQTQTGLPIYV